MPALFVLLVAALLLVSSCGTSPEVPIGADDLAPEALAAEELPTEWELVWNDEFTGSEIADHWTHEVNAWGGGNNELQYYTARPENSFVSGGNLHIVARKEYYEGEEGARAFTSARLVTRGNGDWKYGRFEIRARLPEGQGIWPAIWMLPTDEVYGGWAASGEIDIVELVGHQPDRVHGTLHYGGEWPMNTYTGDSYRLPDDETFGDSFHVFTLIWQEGAFHWFVDGEHYQTQRHWRTQGHEFPAPFDERFHMLLNVAVGGNWPGSPDETTEFPQEMVVDYVRVYQSGR
ncbi:MAG: glycoside hydrolase family 16 protein [Spirochaetota bacterium]